MKNKVFVIFVILLFSSLIQLASGQQIPNYYDKYVNDFSGIFNETETAYLRELLYEVDLNTTAEVVVVTITSSEGYTLADYAMQIADKWKVGKADKDNGLIVLYALTENLIWVATGYGLEGILPDSKLGRMLDDYYVPLRDQGNSKGGIIAFTEQAAKVIEDNKEEVISAQAWDSGDYRDLFEKMILTLLAICFFLWIIIIMTNQFTKTRLKISKPRTLAEKRRKRRVEFINLLLGIFILLVIYSWFYWLWTLMLLIVVIIRILIGPIYDEKTDKNVWIGSSWSGGGGSGFGGGGFGGGGFGGGGAGR